MDLHIARINFYPLFLSLIFYLICGYFPQYFSICQFLPYLPFQFSTSRQKKKNIIKTSNSHIWRKHHTVSQVSVLSSFLVDSFRIDEQFFF